MAKKKLFKFASERQKRIVMPSARAEKLRDPADEPPFFIRGMQAGSKDEYWVSLALLKFEKDFNLGWDYQVPLYGGRSRRGGQVVDFLVYTPGPWTVLDVLGRYWHTGHHEDRDIMQHVCRRRGWRLVQWFTDETPSRVLVESFLRRELGV